MICPNVLIYPYNPFSLYDGGTVALYQLANILSSQGVNVGIHPCRGCNQNPLFNKFIEQSVYQFDIDFDLSNDDNTVVIYTETTIANPLNAKKVVRWVMSEIGKIVPRSYVSTWGQNDLVYYFNAEPKFSKSPLYKSLTTLYVNQDYKNQNLNRAGTCFTIRKGDLNFSGWQRSKPPGPYFYPSKTLNIKREADWVEIKREDACHGVGTSDYLNVFNSKKYFVSYDPLTFLSFIAALCGCVSIVNPCEGMNKKEWLSHTSFWPYLCFKGLDNINGVAYGMDDIPHAVNTMDGLAEQLVDFCEFCKNNTIIPFVEDITKYNEQLNTVGNITIEGV